MIESMDGWQAGQTDVRPLVGSRWILRIGEQLYHGVEMNQIRFSFKEPNKSSAPEIDRLPRDNFQYLNFDSTIDFHDEENSDLLIRIFFPGSAKRCAIARCSVWEFGESHFSGEATVNPRVVSSGDRILRSVYSSIRRLCTESVSASLQDSQKISGFHSMFHVDYFLFECTHPRLTL